MRPVHPTPLCDDWHEASHGRQGFHAEIYEWQLEAILATAKLDAATKSRIMTALGPTTPVPDATATRRLERELRDLGMRNALGQLPDASYFEHRGKLLAELDEARNPRAARVEVDPKRAIRYLENLESLWSAPVPESGEHQDLRQTYERRRADATAAGFATLAALGPELVRIELAEDPHTAAPLALSLHPEKAELTGERAHVLRSLLGGNRSRIHFAQTYDAARKRSWRERGNGTLRYVGRGERSQPDRRDLNVPLLLACEIAGQEPLDAPGWMTALTGVSNSPRCRSKRPNRGFGAAAVGPRRAAPPRTAARHQWASLP